MARRKQFDETQVLEKAMELFWHKGYHGTSIEDLVNHLGINRASLYSTFGNKDQLFRATLSNYRMMSQTEIMRAIDTSKPIPEIIQQMLEYAMEQAMSDPLRKGCFMVNTTAELAPHDESIAEIVRQNQLEMETNLKELLKKGQMDGSINTNFSACTLSKFIINSLIGIRINSKSCQKDHSYEDVVKVILSVLQKE